MKFSILTLGCKVNQYESERLACELRRHGLTKTSLNEQADITIINTCTVTALADSKARQLVSRALRSTKGKVIVTGCGVNNKNSGLLKFDNVEFFKQEEKTKIASMFGGSFAFLQGKTSSNRSRPFLKIQDGCDHQCSYCIVPLVRGPSKSLPFPEIKEQAKVFLEQGFKEIVLIGVDIGAYEYKKQTLVHLIKELLKLDKDFRIRLSSIEPQSLTEQFIEYFANEKRIASHIHIPLQSGSDRILKLMNRAYSVNGLKELIKKLRWSREDLAITTDVIVGFPQEEEKDFKETLKIVEEFFFSKLHVFKFSKREGTQAFSLKDQVDEQTKKSRSKETIDLGNRLTKEYLKDQVGKKLEILIEKKEKKGFLSGLSQNYVRVLVKEQPLINRLVNVKIIGYEGSYLLGEVEKN